ncbi:hypothetical protein ABZ816_03140 [Actinosynnema sp. NPDC047251]|uniref:hypothetical protein n=1 Tax=Saccharothrix espanaensis TaxID=103731 RepID=UPI0002D3D96F|nr:hypothetical protein [Saccharothrix espanaensis]
MRDDPPTAEPTRFEVGVAVVIAACFGVFVSAVAGFEVFAIALFMLPVVGYALGAALLLAMALTGAWCAVRGRRSWRGFGVGLVVGWVLLAVWTSGLTLGIAPLFD